MSIQKIESSKPYLPYSVIHNENETQIKQPPWNPKFIVALLILSGFVFLGSSIFWERFKDNPDLNQEEVEAAQKEAEEITERHEVWIQYVLIADYPGKRPCMRCPGGVALVTLKTGEVYKYGITTQGRNRYSESYYAKLGLTYIEEFRGSYEECKAREINKIMAYRFLPQSKKPEVKLVRPPGNANKN
ncbi:MAG: hypothetical protein AAF798_08575 [Bacteroidota bacterium]